MFTGLIETTGIIKDISTSKISIITDLSSELKLGGSVSVNGVCLTVTRVDEVSFMADMSPQTLSITNFNTKKPGDLVNLERAMKFASRIDGHLVYGHIDTLARITNIVKAEGFYTVSICIPIEFNKYIVAKGSIAVEGVSLTISEEDSFGNIKIAVIPHTWEVTALKKLSIGSWVNIEFDMISKYVEKNTIIYHNKSRINLEFLEENGFV